MSSTILRVERQRHVRIRNIVISEEMTLSVQPTSYPNARSKQRKNSSYKRPFLKIPMYVVNFEMEKTLKRVPFNVVSGQITSDTLWK